MAQYDKFSLKNGCSGFRGETSLKCAKWKEKCNLLLTGAFPRNGNLIKCKITFQVAAISFFFCKAGFFAKKPEIHQNDDFLPDQKFRRKFAKNGKKRENLTLSKKLTVAEMPRWCDRGWET